MADAVPNSPSRRKADALADAINRLIQNLVIRCAKEEGVRDYFHAGVIGYGTAVGPAFSGALSGKELVAISEIGNMPARIEDRTRKIDDGAGGIAEQAIRLPIWFDPVAGGGTPMCQALALAKDVIQRWIAQHPSSFPPVVIQITDGESTDGDPSNAMRSLKELSTQDGNILLFNIHISSDPGATPIAFPDSPAQLPNAPARILFEGSSVLTAFMRSIANAQHGLNLSDGARGFVLNGDMVLVVQALDIGTRPSNLR
ncbi:MAG TPA: vWA domain-containing protein [Candidatus Acidoferrales bacterium]|jgi:hypothetical protein|nr:vWA domain-containing protein [Candidatus Acidoferrales bacterium]